MSLGLLDKLWSQQILAGKWGAESWIGKELVEGASWPGIYIHGPEEGNSVLPVVI